MKRLLVVLAVAGAIVAGKYRHEINDFFIECGEKIGEEEGLSQPLHAA